MPNVGEVVERVMLLLPTYPRFGKVEQRFYLVLIHAGAELPRFDSPEKDCVSVCLFQK